MIFSLYIPYSWKQVVGLILISVNLKLLRGGVLKSVLG